MTINKFPLFLTFKFVFFSLFFMGSAYASQVKESIKLTTKIWPPYHYYDNSGVLTGQSVEVVQCAFNQIDTPFSIEILPWARAQHAVKNNFADGFFSASWNASRDIYAVRTTAIAEQNWAWFYIDPSINPDDEMFKSSVDVVATNGSNIATWLNKNNYRLVTKVAETENLVSMLLNNRISVFMGNELAVEAYIKENNINKTIYKSIARSMPVGIYLSKVFLSKQDKHYMTSLNTAIQFCRNEIQSSS